MVEYVIQALKENEIEKWIAFCGGIFSVGPKYFHRHYFNDPNKDFNTIFVMKNEINEIVSTVRIFNREVYIGGKKYKMGGIGEVSTALSYRNRGLSAKVLHHCVEYMKSNDYSISLLGASKYSHYEKQGFMKVKYYNKTIKINRYGEFDIRKLNANNFNDMEKLYNKYCIVHDMCIVRSSEYWSSWVRNEIKNPYGLFIDNKLICYMSYDNNMVGEIVGDELYFDDLLTFIKNDTITIPEFVYTKNEVVNNSFYSSKMINVFKSIDVDGNGLILDITKDIVEYFNNNRSVVVWRLDSY